MLLEAAPYVEKLNSKRYLPKGYRLPTETEYRAFDKIDQLHSHLGKLIASTTGDQQKVLIRKRADIAGGLIEYLESKKIYDVRGSNRFIRNLAVERRPVTLYIPAGKRLPTFAEYLEISGIQTDIERAAMAIETTLDEKKKRNRVYWYRKLIRRREAAIGKEIYYVPRSDYYQDLMISSSEEKEV